MKIKITQLNNRSKKINDLLDKIEKYKRSLFIPYQYITKTKMQNIKLSKDLIKYNDILNDIKEIYEKIKILQNEEKSILFNLLYKYYNILLDIKIYEIENKKIKIINYVMENKRELKTTRENIEIYLNLMSFRINGLSGYYTTDKRLKKYNYDDTLKLLNL